MTGVTTKHDDYTMYADSWEEMRHHLSGSKAIKTEGRKYLPMLGSPTDQEDLEDYEKYKARALYYEATKRTREAMLGAVLMKPPTYTNLTDDEKEEEFAQVTMNGYSMSTFVRNVMSELVGVSRTGVLIDRAEAGATAADAGEQYLVQYNAENILNWRYERIEDKITLTLVVLREVVTEADGRFSSEEVTRYRVLEMVDGVYVQSLFEEVYNEAEKATEIIEQTPIVPSNKGEPLTYIPFVFFTPLGNVPTVSEPILSSIATINISHYMSSADLEHGRHFTGLPTAWVAGFNNDTELRIGSQVAWVSSEPNARAGFLEFTGTGLGSLVTALAEKQEQMATMGARMLRPPKTGIEAAETARIYQSAESGTLASLATSAGESFTTLLQYWFDWKGQPDKGVKVDMNTDYVDTRMDAQTLAGLLQAWMSGAISYETLFYNMQNGELMPDGTDADTERDLIDVAGPPVLSNDTGTE